MGAVLFLWAGKWAIGKRRGLSKDTGEETIAVRKFPEIFFRGEKRAAGWAIIIIPIEIVICVCKGRIDLL